MICPICLEEKVLIHEHHIIPQSAGGSSGPTIDICSQCHDALHLCATKILAGKGAEAQIIAGNIFKDKKLSQDLVKSIIKHRLLKKDGKIPDENLELKMTLVFPAAIRRYLEVLSKNSKTGMNTYVTYLIKNHIKSKFPDARI